MSNMLLGELVSPSKIMRKGGKNIPFLSMNRKGGLVVNERINTSSKTQESSKIVGYGQLVIGLHMNEGSIWVQNALKEGAVSPAYEVMDVNLDLIDPTYMNYALHTNQCIQFYKSAGVSSTSRRSKVPWESLKSMPLKVPSLDEQRESINLIRIIGSLKQKIQRVLSKIDGMQSSLFKESVGGSDTISIEKIANITFGKTPALSSESPIDALTFISGASDFGKVFTEGKKKVDSAERIVDSGSVLISVRDPVGKVNIASEKCAIGRGVVGVTPKKDVATSSYIYLALKEKQNELNSMAYGIIKSIGPREIRGIALHNMNINEQKRLSESFDKIEKIRAALETMLSSTDVLYQKILHEKFS